MRGVAVAAAMFAVAHGEEDFLVPNPPLPDVEVGETLNFVSATLGDHMVLQRAPQQAVVWGHTTPNATVSTNFDGTHLQTTADASGTWRQRLPPTPASMEKHSLTFNSSAGETGSLSDVLFGDVYVCGGQSNMQFSVPGVTNATEELLHADDYPWIRVFTVGQYNQASTPYRDLQRIEERWSVAGNNTVGNGNAFGYFSAVCWFFGKRISDKLQEREGSTVPLGLVSNNWGGTKVELWSTADSLKTCGVSATANGTLYNSMIAPYALGPMAVTGFTWYQGESNVGGQTEADDYACRFPAMITAWRKAFQRPNAYFSFVQLSTWCARNQEQVGGIPEMRQAQLAALKLPNVGYATNVDHGAGCNIHPPPKQYCGARLGDSALALQYKEHIQWQSPTYESASATVSGTTATVTVKLAHAAAVSTDTFPANYVAGLNCTDLDAHNPGQCGWASIGFGLTWVNATIQGGDGAVTLTARAPAAGAKVTATSYGWAPVPLLNAYDTTTGLPVLPWNMTL